MKGFVFFNLCLFVFPCGQVSWVIFFRKLYLVVILVSFLYLRKNTNILPHFPVVFLWSKEKNNNLNVFHSVYFVPSFVHMFFSLPSFCLFPLSFYCSFFSSLISFPHLICHLEDNIFTSGNIFFMTVCRFNLADLFRGRGLRKWFLRTGRAKKKKNTEKMKCPETPEKCNSNEHLGLSTELLEHVDASAAKSGLINIKCCYDDDDDDVRVWPSSRIVY